MAAIDALTQEGNVIFSVAISPTRIRQEVFIALRLDDSNGTGTIEDPYNGRDDSYLDALLNDPTKITPEMTLRFGPGIFQTKGNGGANGFWFPRDGQKFCGAGMHQTTLQLVKAAPAGSANYVAPIGFDANVSDLEISDMTIDANLSRQPLIGGAPPAIRADAVRLLGGKNVRIRRVRAINWGTYLPDPNLSSSREGFPIYVAGQVGTESCENIVEDCIIEQPNPWPGREVTLLNIHATLGSDNTFCTLRNNYLNADFTTGTPPPSIIVSGVDYVSGTGILTVQTAWPHRLLENHKVVLTGISTPFADRFAVTTIVDWRTFKCSVGAGLGPPVLNPGAAAQLYVPRAMLLGNLSWPGSGVVVTVTTPLPHGRKTGDYIRISGVKVTGSSQSIFNNPYNGSFKVQTVPSSNTLTYFVDAAPSAAPDSPLSGIWLDRWPSQNAAVNADVSPGGFVLGLQWLWQTSGPPGNILFKVTTAGPHYKAPGDYAWIIGVGSSDARWNGWFKVIEWAPDMTSKCFFVSAYLGANTPMTELVQSDLQGSLVGQNFQALSAHQGYGPIVRANRVIGANRAGPYHDTYNVNDIIVWDNYFYFVKFGQVSVAGHGATEDRSLTERNIVDLQPNPIGAWNHPQPTAFSFGGASDLPVTFQVIIVRRNIVRYVDEALPVSRRVLAVENLPQNYRRSAEKLLREVGQ